MKLFHHRYSVLRTLLLMASLLICCMAATSQCHSAESVWSEPQPMVGHPEFLITARETGTGIESSAGKTILEPRYRQIDYLGEKIFGVRMEDSVRAEDQWLLLNSSGKTIAVLPNWTDTSGREFKCGVLRIDGGSDNLAYINTKGQFIAQNGRFRFGQDFSEGFAAIQIYDRNGWTGGFIDRKGRLVIGPFPEGECSSFWKGKSIVRLRTKNNSIKTGVISTNGKFIIPPIYTSIRLLNDGEQPAIGLTGDLLSYQNGFVLVKSPQECNEVTIPSKVSADTLLPCCFKSAGDCRSSWGYCDLQGNIVIGPKFSSCGEFVDGVAFASIVDVSNQEDLRGTIDKHGNWLQPPSSMFSREQSWATASFREPLFLALLKTHDFIGMPKSEWEGIFGKFEVKDIHTDKLLPTWCKQVFELPLMQGARCGVGACNLELGLDGDLKIVGWRIHGNERNESWVTENVVCTKTRFGLPGDLIPKNETKLVKQFCPQ